MTHFDGWEKSWRVSTTTRLPRSGKDRLDAKKDLKLGDFQDGNFRKWTLMFRI